MELAHRVSAVDRLEWRERYREAAARAIRHRHRHADKLAITRPEELSDEQLVETVMRLEGWLLERPPLPIEPDSWLAGHGE
jgi:hypothetical protein